MNITTMSTSTNLVVHGPVGYVGSNWYCQMTKEGVSEDTLDETWDSVCKFLGIENQTFLKHSYGQYLSTMPVGGKVAFKSDGRPDELFMIIRLEDRKEVCPKERQSFIEFIRQSGNHVEFEKCSDEALLDLWLHARNVGES